MRIFIIMKNFFKKTKTKQNSPRILDGNLNSEVYDHLNAVIKLDT